jgi:hypothetical protein
MPDDPQPDARLKAAIAAALAPVLQRLTAAEQTNAQLSGELDELKVRVAAGGTLPSKIAMKSAHGTYLTAEPDGRVTNREREPAVWQMFWIEKV